MSAVQWRAWVKQAWVQSRQWGTPQAVERALAAFDVTGTVQEPVWARFWIALTSIPITVGPAPLYDDGHLYDDGTLVGVSGDPVAIGVLSRDIRAAALGWKPARSRYMFAALGLNGAVLYDGGAVYDGGSLYTSGGDVAYL
jgi:hypothetical protein